MNRFVKIEDSILERKKHNKNVSLVSKNFSYSEVQLGTD